MKLCVESNSFRMETLWKFKTTEKFNVLKVATLFNQTGLRVIVGGEDGIIRIYDLFTTSGDVKPQALLETKSGPIQSLGVHDVTKFYDQDLIVADSWGMLTIFCNHQIISRQKLSDSSLNHLQICSDQSGSKSIVSSDDSGLVCGNKVSEELWKINLNNRTTIKEPSEQIIVKSLLSVDICDQFSHTSNYVLVADNSEHLHILHEGSIINVLKTPGVVVAMCKGWFMNTTAIGYQAPTNREGAPAASIQENTQVLLGTESGAIYLLHNFTISADEYARVPQIIVSLNPIHLPEYETDLVICAGYFNSLDVFHEGRKIGSFPSPDWISTVDTADIDGDGVTEIVFGCMDNTIQAVKISVT